MPFPNKETQFKPGQSGNPAGLPKGTKHINTVVQELLNDDEFNAMILEGLQVKEFKGAPIGAIVKAQIIKAINGDTKAYDSLVKSGWAQKSEVENSGEQKIIVETRKVSRTQEYESDSNED